MKKGFIDRSERVERIKPQEIEMKNSFVKSLNAEEDEMGGPSSTNGGKEERL
jgi:hypothetical protein